MARLSSHVAADVLASRPATILRVVAVGRLAIIWDTGERVRDREAGNA